MKTSFKRLLSLILAFAIIFCAIPGIFATEVDAATVTMTEYSSYIGRTWFKWYTQYPGYGSTVFDTGDYWTDTIAYFTVNDGRTAFCVEPHIAGVTGTHTSVSWDYMDSFKRRGITLALAYGAPNNGKTSEDAIYGTAAVVWDMACGYRNFDGSFMYASGVGTLTSSPFASALAAYKPGAYAEYNAILAKIANHGTIPSFAVKLKSQLTDANKITLRFNASNGKYEATVTDTNGVLENFNFISPLNGLTFSKNGNTLKISATAEAAANLQSATTIVNRGNEVEVSPDLCTLWQPSNGQTVCTLDVATDPVPCYFALEAEPVEADVNVVKTSTDGKVDGISFNVKNNTTGVSSTATTANGGKFSFKAKVGDSVTITEIVPEGYVNTAASKTITVAAGTNTVTFHNILRQGQIKVTKSGMVFSSVIEADGKYQPVYSMQGLSGAVYEVTAAEDIYSLSGELIYSAGDVVDTITTDATGVGTSDLLYLGKYSVTETTAPAGMVLNTEAHPVELTYTGQEAEVVTSNVGFYNERQKAVISLDKILEQDSTFGVIPENEMLSVSFGLYAAEDLTATDGKVIPADGLLEVAACEESGKLTFATDVPAGAKLYVQEISTDAKYILSDEKYPVEFTYAGQNIDAVAIPVNDGNAITNELIRGTIVGKKVDEDGFEICGAKFGLFGHYETEFTEENAILTAESNEIGIFVFEDVPYGSYVVRELEPAPAFVLNDTLYDVTVDEDGDVVEITVENAFLVGSVKTTKVDAENPENKLTGAVFEVYVDVDGDKIFDADIDILVGEMNEIETGVYRMDNLRYNGYFLHEKTAPENFIKDDGYYYFEIRKDGEIVIVENEAGVGFINLPSTGSLELTKTDADDGKLLPDAGFRIRNEDGEVVAEGYTDKNGVAKFTLRVGKYTYQEFDAPEGYVIDESEFEFEIKENGEIVKAEMTNTPTPDAPKTGDTSKVGLWAVLLTVSVVAIGTMFFFYKKERMNRQ